MKKNEIKIGTPVTYWGIMKDSGEKYDPFETEIESDYWALGGPGGTIVCKVKGMSGCVSIKHLEKRYPVIES